MTWLTTSAGRESLHLRFFAMAKNPAVRASAREAIWPLRCYPLAGTWRVPKQQPDKPAVIGLGKLELQSYLLPPEDAQLRFPDEFWPEQHQENGDSSVLADL